MNGCGRIIGLDVGDRRIGVAVSDELMITAQPLTTIERRSAKEDIKRIASISAETGAELIVVGMPLMLSNREGVQAEKVKAFIRELQRLQSLPVETMDERMTTAFAEKAMIESGARRDKRRQNIDKVAAAAILQSYMDRKAAGRDRPDSDIPEGREQEGL